jgi:Dehydrogenases (flavoproteins)
MPFFNKRSVIIIGAGPAGCYAAILLKKQGFDVEVFEKQAEEVPPRDSEGRSVELTIALLLWECSYLVMLRML